MAYEAEPWRAVLFNFRTTPGSNVRDFTAKPPLIPESGVQTLFTCSRLFLEYPTI
jgi:hypothetical protein